MTESKRRWQNAFAPEELEPGGCRVVKHDGGNVAVFRLPDGSIRAVDNACPHEGYPLSKGDVRDGLITCPWHNYKFALADGRCVKGDEDVRCFDVRVDDGLVQIDVTPPDPAVAIAKATASLDDGLLRRRMGQAARDVVRLLQLGVTPAKIAGHAARFDAERAEWGCTHAVAVAADSLRYLDRHHGLQAVRPLMQALDMASEPNVRRDLRARPEPEDPGSDPHAAGRRLRERVECEDAAGAEALIRGALARGWGRREIEPWLFALCCDHFLSFGHPLIYQTKVFELLDATEWQHADAILGAHVFGIVNATREDTLPEWAHYRRRLAASAPSFEAWLKAEGDGDGDGETFFAALVDGDRDDAYDALDIGLAAGVPTRRLVDALSRAAHHRILRFDLDIDSTDAVQEGWLDVTHTATFANAVRIAVQRYDDPDALRLLYQATRFITTAKVLDGPTRIPEPLAEASLDRVLYGITSGDSVGAMAATLGYLRSHAPVTPLEAAFHDLPLTDGHTRAIVVAHVLKGAVVAFDEHRHLGGDPLPLVAFARLAASPVRERWVGRWAHEAIRFVHEGKVPRTLT